MQDHKPAVAHHPLIALHDLTLGHDRHPAVHHLNLSVQSGDLVAVVGPNGAGKTTTLLGISGALPVQGGELVAPVDQALALLTDAGHPALKASAARAERAAYADQFVRAQTGFGAAAASSH